MTNLAPTTFGDLLRRLRAAAGLTQEDLAFQAGLSVEAVSALERGTRHTPRKETVQLLAEALQLDDANREALLAARRREVASNTLRQVEVAEPSGGIGPSVQTYLVGGLRGYSRVAQDHGEALATRFATRFVAILREVVVAAGGRVVQQQGGQAVAVFPLPRQALQAAVALRGRLTREPPSQLPLPVSIGVDAGEAASASGGSVGGAAAVAARLAGLAGPGEALASEGVIHLARRIAGIYYLERGVAQLKGVEDPVRIVQVLNEPPAADSTESPAPAGGKAKKTATAAPEEAPSEAPLPIGGFLGALPDAAMVARDAELVELRAALEATRNRTGRCVLLGGEPGVGKTRLAQEATVEARSRDFFVATGRCYEPQRSVPFFPFREALAVLYAAAPPNIRAEAEQLWPDALRLLPVAPSASGDGAQTSLDSDRAAPTPDASAETSPQTGAPSGQEEQQRLFWAVTSFLRALADVRPVALLLDDLQWADRASLALLQHLARHTRASRVFLLGIYRDDEVGRDHPLQAVLRDLGREHLLQRMAVKRLAPEGTAALVKAALGEEDEVPESLVALIHRGTDGNAFFAREVLRALVERGELARQDGKWEPRAGIAIAAPESVRAVIRQRLEALSPTAQEVLQDASVLGQTFGFEDVQAMRDRPEVEVEAALDSAQAAGLIRETGGDDYAFQHGLIQQGIYADLPSRRRQRMHRVAGEHLQQLPERTRMRRAAELAWHFVEGGVPESALPYALQAGDQAETVFAHHEAEQHYLSALDLARELGERGSEAEALYKLGSLLMTTARYDEATQMLERAAEVSRASGDREGRRRAMAQLGRVYARRGTPQEGVRRLEPLLATMTGTLSGTISGTMAGASSGQPSRGIAALQIALADLYYTSGRYRDQLSAAERAAEIARALGDDALLARAEQWRSTALLALGRAQEALPVLQEVLPRSEAAGDLSSHTHALSHVALAYIQRGEFEEGRSYIERALALAERRGDPAQIAFMAYNRGMIAVYTGEWEQARADYERAASVMQRVGLSWTSAYPQLGLGHLSLIQGRWDEASRQLQQAVAMAERSNDLQALRYAQIPLIERDLLEGRTEVARARLDRLFDPRGSGHFDGMSNLLALAAWLRLELGDLGQAAALVEQARTQAEAEQNQLALVEALRVQAGVLQRQGKSATATAAIERSLTLARAMPCPQQTARVLYTYGLVLKDQGKDTAARERLREAQGLLSPLGERLYAQHVEAALAELGPGER